MFTIRPIITPFLIGPALRHVILSVGAKAAEAHDDVARAKIGPKHPSQFVRESGKTAGKTISREARKKFATLIEKQPGPRGGRMFYRFPIPSGDEAAARNTLACIPVVKELSAEEKKRSPAKRFLLFRPESAGRGGV
jgi:hypothetical protein